MSTAFGFEAPPWGEVGVLAPVPHRVVERRLVGPDLVTLVLEPVEPHPEPVVYGPGQFVMVWAPGVGEIPISVSGIAAGGVLELTIKALGATSTAVVGCQPGETLGVRGPYGTCWPVEQVEGRSVLVVAGGLGLAPLRLAIRSMLDGPGAPRRLEIVHGARVPDQLVFTDEHDDWADRGATVRTIVDRPDDGWLGPVGNVLHLLHRLVRHPGLRPDLVMVCGPEVMMRAVVRYLLAAGVRAGDIHVSLERNMHCAVGICGRCQLGPWVLCRDGVVMPWSRVARLMEVPGR